MVLTLKGAFPFMLYLGLLGLWGPLALAIAVFSPRVYPTQAGEIPEYQ